MQADPRGLKILHYPNPVLRQATQSIETITEEVRAVADRMLQLMREAGGLGLAAPQVGIRWRLFVANPTQQADDLRIFVNPVLGNPSKEMAEHEEGCLSLPQVTANIRRPQRITIEATDLDGHALCLTDDQIPARVWQHETDHLNGVLIIDRMSQIDRIANRRALRDLEKAAGQ